MRKHFLSILFLLAAAAIWWASISSTVRNPVADNDNPVVVVSGYVPYTLTKQLAGNTVNVIMLLPPGAEPHAFEPTPGVLVSLKHASAFIYMSQALEPWAAELSASVNAQTPVIELARPFDAVQDPHVWMNIENTQQLAQQIAQVLVQINPAQTDLYQTNLAQLEAELATLSHDYKTQLANCQNREVVHVGHLAFAPLAQTYGLKLTALSGTSHEGEHSVKKLAALTQEIKDKHISTIFTEDTLSPRLAKTVAAETGAHVLPLYPIEHISKQDFNNAVTYTALMRRNLESLSRGLQCPV